MAAATWIIQESATSPVINQLTRACRDEGLPLVHVRVTPFSDEMPDMPAGIEPPFFFFGFTTLILNAFRSERWRSGVFFDPDLLTPAASLAHYGDRMLNADMVIATPREIAGQGLAPDAELFIRPNDDFKRLTGQTHRFDDFLAWYDLFKDADDTDIRADTPLMCASAKTIDAEWRIHILEGRAIGGSQYLPVATGFVPPEVIEFAEAAAAHWSPLPAFVLDVAAVGDDLRIIETNCINGSAFYQADVRRIVRSISRYLELR